MRVTRRRFLQVLGGTAGATAPAKVRLSTGEQAGQDLRRWATPEEIGVPSLCQQCPGGCGILVRTLDGEGAGISGNALHPINRGALCPKAFGGLQLLYDPHRLKGPMARDGKHGALRPIAWEEALRLATQRLGELRQRGRSLQLACFGGQYPG